ncbi:uncharacterized protein [Littorina saxatilis]|uniref:NAD-dependent epimerase/dehydratase domain-containing protein n=1 Tax=Littorina saxatilis TaxID=31220 RepID=A0AAN9ANG4_9CAEN
MAAASEDSLVLVTGASGYIATHVIKQLQEAGYKVRGTVRSLSDEAKVKHLNDLCPDATYKLELVEADLTKPDSWEAAVKGVSYVIHVASPFPASAPKDENEVIQPAVEGTQSVLKACIASKSVKRVVLTSSCVAVNWSNTNTDKVHTEEDWSDVESLDAYAKSKTLAEKAAWDFIKELPDEDKIELAVINPAYVMGPVLHGSQCTSMEIIKRLLERSMPACPKLNFAIVDVRDVATAHVKAMTLPEAAGNRHLVVNTNMWMKEIAQQLAKEFKPQGYNVPTVNCPYFALWMSSLFDKTIKMILPQVNKVHKFENKRMKEVLGIEPLDAKDTIIEMAYSLIESGFIKKTKKYKGPGGIEETKAEEDKTEEKADEKKEEGKEDEKAKENGNVKEDAAAEDKKEDKTEEPAKTETQAEVEQKTEETKPEETKAEEAKPEEKAEEATAEKTEN